MDLASAGSARYDPSMNPRFPSPVLPGSTIAVTAPSSGVPDSMRARFGACKRRVEERGFTVELGSCLFGGGIVSAPTLDRARELQRMMTRADLSLVMPPWGGELAIHLLEHLDFEAIRAADAPWFAGWSDGSTFALPLLLLSGCASLHGMNFMDSAFAPAAGVAWWLDVLATPRGGTFTQRSLTSFQRGFKDYEEFPEVDAWEPTEPSRWRRLGADADAACEVAGRLVGGCLDTLVRLAGTRFGDVPRFARASTEPLLIYLENCEMSAADACRALHQLRLAGWFDRVSGVLIGRTKGGPTEDLTQVGAVEDALGALDVPVLYDVDVSHVPPQLMIVNGALGQVRYEGGAATIEQTLR